MAPSDQKYLTDQAHVAKAQEILANNEVDGIGDRVDCLNLEVIERNILMADHRATMVKLQKRLDKELGKSPKARNNERINALKGLIVLQTNLEWLYPVPGYGQEHPEYQAMTKSLGRNGWQLPVDEQGRINPGPENFERISSIVYPDTAKKQFNELNPYYPVDGDHRVNNDPNNSRFFFDFVDDCIVIELFAGGVGKKLWTCWKMRKMKR